MPVYVVEALGTGLALIGWAKDVARRLAALTSSSAGPVHLLRSFEGGSSEALELRLRFREHRHHGSWFVVSCIAGELCTLSKIELVELAGRCPGCGKAKGKSATRADKRGMLCMQCAQKARWASLNDEEKRAAIANITDASNREKGRRARSARVAELRAAKAVCTDCGAALGIRKGKRYAAGADRRCRACAMRATWRRSDYRAAIASSRRKRSVGAPATEAT